MDNLPRTQRLTRQQRPGRSHVVYSVGTKPSIAFPADRDLAVRFVGAYARYGNESSILVRDPNEAAYLARTLGGQTGS